jgi:DNA-binding transcriptional regulator YiaG
LARKAANDVSLQEGINTMTAKLLEFPVKQLSAGEFKALRIRHNVTYIQMANCLDVSVSAIESWENGRRRVPFGKEYIENSISEYQFSGRALEDRNLLFGVVSISAARHMLGEDCETLAKRFNVRTDIWRRFESHREKMPREIIRKLEESLYDTVDQINCERKRQLKNK